MTSKELKPLYKSLDQSRKEVRLIKLHPRSSNAIIRCNLITCSLDNNPVYEALSYVWGKSNNGYTIVLDEHVFATTDNLFHALERLQLSGSTRNVWVDQLCINQDDLDERGQQVRLMNLIYANAVRGLLWLGTEAYLVPKEVPSDQLVVPKTIPCEWTCTSSETEPGVQGCFEAQISQVMLEHHDLEQDPIFLAFRLIADLANLSNSREINHLGQDDEVSENVSRALWFIMHRPWWSRVWTVQECLLPAESVLLYGPVTAPFSMFLRAAINYAARKQVVAGSRPAATLQTMRHFEQTLTDISRFYQTQQSKNSIDLVTILRCFRTREASDERDKVFGFLGLNIEWHGQEPIQPDYNKSINEIYQESTLKHIQGTKSLRIWINNLDENRDSRRIPAKQETRSPPVLPASMPQELQDLLFQIDSWNQDFKQAPYFFNSEEVVHQLPSWVPDWSATTNFQVLARYNQFDLHSAARSTKANVRLIDKAVIALSGIEVDEVRWSSQIMAYNDGPLRSSLFADWLAFSADATQYRSPALSSSNLVSDVFWRTLCGDSIASLDSHSSLPVFRRAIASNYEDFLEWCSAFELDLLPSFIPLPAVQVNEEAHQDNNICDLGLDCRRSKFFYDNNLHKKVHDSNKEPALANGLPPAKSWNIIDPAIRAATTMRRIFITRKGYLGIGPAQTIGGERIFVLSGGRAPFLLRLEKDKLTIGTKKLNCYRVVGDCYVHGIMDGEALDMNLQQQEILLV